MIRDGREKGFFKRLVSGLAKTRDNIVSGMDSIFHGFSNIDDDFYEELEETLIMGDLGVRATDQILEDLKQKVKRTAYQRTCRLQTAADRQHPGADGCGRDRL